jgi:hypothetical protein
LLATRVKRGEDNVLEKLEQKLALNQVKNKK